MLKRIIAVLLIAALLLSLAGCREKKQSGSKSDDNTAVPSQEPFRIYLNSDWETYYDPETHTSTRRTDKDGLYHIPLILDGDRVELTCTSKKLVNLIDQQAIMSLTFDEKGQISDVVSMYAMPELYLEHQYILNIEDDVVTASISAALSSPPPEFKVTGRTQIYDISPTAEVFGFPTVPHGMDMVTVFTEDGTNEALYIFITQQAPNWPIFWRIDETPGQVSTWDAENKCTTRVPDENGVYTIRMVRDGQQVDVLCKDIAIVNKIDSLPQGEQYISLSISEDGYIDNWAVTYKGSQQFLECSQFDVTQLGEDGFTTTRTLPGSIQGAIWEGNFAEDCRIYDTTGSSGPVGVRVDSLQLNDRVIVLGNWDGDATTIFITQRSVEN